MTYIARHHPQIAYLLERSALPMPAQIAIAFAVMVTKWSIRSRTRRQLSHLDAHILKDIDVTKGMARHESTLPFWHP
ncbi:DUF1127 domain-containing protein [Epibacterium ulvae]|uniref:DUF1127 domain-containing protein n=1 Tax=Epibacterium ulvae TaxID=1156985 RepID=UPI001BFC659C|nr:DUF1127 domain-containing protein [Epibacterium ulvae]MBT8156015.1 DUF1127 domain-containing protein [Epibacterium ulvae]